MTKLSKKVNVKEPIVPDRLPIEKDDSFPEAYAIEIPLDSIPDGIWEQCFERELKASLYTLKRQVMVLGANLRAVTTPDEVRGTIKWIRELVKATNQCVEENNREMMQREQAEKARKKREEETVKRMRESLRQPKE